MSKSLQQPQKSPKTMCYEKLTKTCTTMLPTERKNPVHRNTQSVQAIIRCHHMHHFVITCTWGFFVTEFCKTSWLPWKHSDAEVPLLQIWGQWLCQGAKECDQVVNSSRVWCIQLVTGFYQTSCKYSAWTRYGLWFINHDHKQ